MTDNIICGRSRKKALLAALAGVAISVFAYGIYQECAEAKVMRIVRPDGVALASGEKEITLFDHGPYTFGSWQELPLLPGLELRKMFCVPRSFLSGKGSCSWKIYFSGDRGELIIKNANGKMTRYILAKGENNIDIPASAGRNDEAYLQVVSVSGGDACAVFDRQRNYGRSEQNGIKLPGELVARQKIDLQ